MGTIKYHIARLKDGRLVDVNELTEATRHQEFYCIGCGELLVPKMGSNNRWHFAHKRGENCSQETYLHKLGKELVKKRFDEGLTFDVQFIQYQDCIEKNKCPLYQEERDCSVMKYQTVDFKKYYTDCIVESQYGDFRPDLLLVNRNDNSIPPIFIEICVTHPCDDKKINSDNKIIEIFIAKEDENTIIKLSNDEIIETLKDYSDDKKGCDVWYKFHNFKKVSSLLSSDVELPFDEIYLTYDRRILFNHMDGTPNCKDLFLEDGILAKSVQVSNYVGKRDRQTNFLIQAMQNGLDIKDCRLCSNCNDFDELQIKMCNAVGEGNICFDNAENCPAYRYNTSFVENAKRFLCPAKIVIANTSVLDSITATLQDYNKRRQELVGQCRLYSGIGVPKIINHDSWYAYDEYKWIEAVLEAEGFDMRGRYKGEAEQEIPDLKEYLKSQYEERNPDDIWCDYFEKWYKEYYLVLPANEQK